MSSPYLSKLEFTIALPSVIIGLSILSLPASLANITSNSDGWVVIVIAGGIATIFALLAVHIAAHFPEQPFFKYASTLVTKPIAIIIALLYMVALIIVNAYTTRTVAYIAQEFLFERTPMEVLGLIYLLVVIYAVTGLRIGLFRLNLMFFPIILIVFLLTGAMNAKWFSVANYLPLFKTSLEDYGKGTLEVLYGFAGMGIGLFYICMMEKPVQMTKSVLGGMGITIFFYIVIFLVAIGVWGNDVTANIRLPALELARIVDIPGGLFERVDAFVYTVWMMGVFNTVTIVYDMAVILWMSVFKRHSKPVVVFVMAPVIFFIGMLPKSMDIVYKLTREATIFTLIMTTSIIILFYIMIKWKGISRHETS